MMHPTGSFPSEAQLCSRQTFGQETFDKMLHDGLPDRRVAGRRGQWAQRESAEMAVACCIITSADREPRLAPTATPEALDVTRPSDLES